MKRLKDGAACIAVVEDEPDLRALICRWLSPRYRTVSFASAEEFLASEDAAVDADAVVTDVRMEGMNGFRLCERIRANPRCGHRPVVLLTGVRPEEGLFTGQRVGASAYLAKPVGRDCLLEQLEKLLDPLAN